MLILDTMMEGTVSQNFDLGPRFHFMKCGKLGLKVTLFCDKIKTKTLIKKKTETRFPPYECSRHVSKMLSFLLTYKGRYHCSKNKSDKTGYILPTSFHMH